MSKIFLWTAQAALLLLLLVGLRVAAAPLSDLRTPDKNPACRTCHLGPYRHQIDDSRDPWCEQCHRIHGLPETLGLRLVSLARPIVSEGRRVVPRMIKIPAGEFVMGENSFKKSAGPRHRVTLGTYLIDAYDVTNAQYREFLKATRRPPPHWLGGRIPPGKESHPVTFVNWFEADAYCRSVGKRLPTEAEWEKAARGTDGRTFPWGNRMDRKRANVPPLGIGDTTPVDSFENGKSPYGVYDMAGNVFQWTSEWFLPYPGNTIPHPNYGEKLKVLRGGSFFDCSYYRCGLSFQTYNRIALAPTTRAVSAGFRCAANPG